MGETPTIDLALHAGDGGSGSTRRVVVASLVVLAIGALPVLALARDRSNELDWFAAVVLISASDSSYEFDQTTDLGYGKDEIHASIDGSTMYAEFPRDSKMDTLYVDGDRAIFHNTVGWQEYLTPARSVDDLRRGSDNLWEALVDAKTVEIARESTRITYDAKCVSGKVRIKQSAWICDPQAAATIRVVVDERAQRVVALHIDGQIPIYPGKWERGSVDIQYRPDAEIRFVAPDDVDASGLSCLAHELDMPRIDRAALRARIAKWTTEQLRELFYVRCGFERWPSGTDFD